jgi:ketosteroid isomerase-like protein
MKSIIISILMLSFFSGCKPDNAALREKAKKEIEATEKEFAFFCKKEGLEAAFFKYADNDAVIHRDNKIIKGKLAIREFYRNRPAKNISLDWAPEFVAVSISGDLGYTYGNFTYISRDSLGKANEFKGIFHTVWKKQSDGTWRFVWD